MDQTYDVLIFSLFGRNHWLASQLKSQGLKVALFDFSPLFYKGLAEDWEGPFPLIFPDDVARSNSQSFKDQDRFETIHQGPSLRVKGLGVFEFKSSHGPYALSQWGQKGLWMYQEDQVPEPYKTQSNKSKEGLSEYWLSLFLRQWRSSRLTSLENVPEDIPSFPLNANFILRHPSRRGFIESSVWLNDIGVQTLPSSSWWKCVFKENQWMLTMKEQDVQVKAKQLVLGLTSYELFKFSGQLEIPQEDVYPPSAFWIRWRGRVKDPSKLSYVPLYSMFLADPEIGIYNENFVSVIQRSQGEVDVWSCLSCEVLSQKGFHENLKKSILNQLKKFVPEFGTLRLDELRLGSDLFSFWPLYRKNKPVFNPSLRLILDSPETWPGLDNYSRYIHQTKIIESFKEGSPFARGVEASL